MAFNIELAIEAWRSMLVHRRMFFEEDLEELERHLRDHTANLVEQGWEEEDAFRHAQTKIGDFAFLEDAYQDVFWRKLKHRGLLGTNITYQFSMIQNYLKLAWRSLTKHKGYSAVNIAGLAVGLVCSFFIVLWVQNELRIDQFHENGEQLYLVKTNDYGGDQVSTWSNVAFPLAHTLTSTYPEVERAILTLPMKAALHHGERASRAEGYYASPGFFEAYTFPLLVGDPATALVDPASIVISETIAATYFGPHWQAEHAVVGKTLTMDYWQSNGGVLGQAVTVNNNKTFTITGVFQEIPQQSSLHFDIVLPLAEVVAQFGHVREWGPRWFELALQLKPEADVTGLEQKIRPFLQEHSVGAEHQELWLHPFQKAYLHGAFEDGRAVGGRIQRVYLLALIGLAILFIACINFTNLVTARSSQRAREIGVRKVLGATPGVLRHQFLGEAVLTAVVAFVFACMLLVMGLPLYNTVADIELGWAEMSMLQWSMFLGIAVLTGLVAGSYPAFYLGSLSAIRAFRRQVVVRKRGEASVRKGLVVVQFGISVCLIVGTLTVAQQLTYMQTKDLGLDKDNIVVVRLEGEISDQYEAVQQRLLQAPSIEQVSRSSAHPLGVAIKNANVLWQGKELDENVLFTVLRTDADFASTMKLNLLKGRFFNEDRDAGTLRYVVNESAVKAMGLDTPIGHPFAFGFDVADGQPGAGEIIGVVKDFHTGSLADEKIAPLVFRYEPSGANVLLVRIAPGETTTALAVLEEVNSALNPGYVFDYAFLDDTYQAYYEDEVILGTLTNVFAGMAIFIACLGLLGLSAFSVQQRTKEVGIRRVLGATKGHVFYILTLEFIKLVVWALVVALPFAYWAMEEWLTGFVYRVDVGFGTLVLSAMLALILALLTVGYQARRAARRDPVHALRYE